MQNRNYTVVDVTKEPEYWRKDIDFIITSAASGATKTFEVKWDERIHETNNLYLELASAYSELCLGWFEICKADYLAYGDAVNGKFYIIPLLELRERVQKLPKRIAQCGKDSIG